MKFIASLLALAILSGCATSSVVVGKVRPAIAPADVKIYVRAPAKYEEIALLETSSNTSWAFSEQGKMDAVIANMKAEAARLGANGVLLSGTGNQQQTSMVFMPLATGGGIMVPASSTSKTGAGMAIYVTLE